MKSVSSEYYQQVYVLLVCILWKKKTCLGLFIFFKHLSESEDLNRLDAILLSVCLEDVWLVKVMRPVFTSVAVG